MPETLLRVLTCGSVDDGKSTLIGRLLYECGRIPDDVMQALERDSRRYGTTGGGAIDYSLLVDGLAAEREQGITIDVAYRYFETERRRFILADAPGHEQYTCNMITGASTADVAVLLVDARKGLLPQTRRHATIAAMLGIRQVIVAVNKMDLVGFDEGVFDGIAAAFGAWAEKLGGVDVTAIPVCAIAGDNVIDASQRLSWYAGPTLLAALEAAELQPPPLSAPARLNVQFVSRTDADFRGYAGTVSSGVIRPGTELINVQSRIGATVARIATMDGDLAEASPGDAVMLSFDGEIDVSRGDVLATGPLPEVADQLVAQVAWFGDTPLYRGRTYSLALGCRTVTATISRIDHRTDIETLADMPASELHRNDIGRVGLSLSQPLAFEPYARNHDLGGFILIDRLTRNTVGAGLVERAERAIADVHWHKLDVDKGARAALKQQRPAVLWFTGFSGAGKSTVANLVEKRLLALGKHTIMLDGDNVRHGLNRDLGFSEADRVENIRRVAEVAKLFVEAGLIVLVSFISPYRAERMLARERVEEGEFIEVFVDTPIDECRRRDPKGLYVKADRGEIRNFTGIDAPYEPPENPEVHLRTLGAEPEELAEQVVRELRRRNLLA
jgi:bifunctional enzyme CysN/CysC